jgi:RNA 3'-terminal phosphate cyclase (ATP)
MIKIDGSQGEGGGQILRSSVALSTVTGTPVSITNIRAGRKKPGLMRQHLTAMRAAAEICDAELAGAELGSGELVFTPGTIQGGDFSFQVGTAGSTTLVLQTVLPALLIADTASTVTLDGGTHNPFAPPFPFLANAYLPLLNRMGVNVTAELIRPGFYPAGGGSIRVSIEPCTELRSLELVERGKIVDRRVRAICANLSPTIGERECRVIKRKTNWDDSCFEVDVISDSAGPGNVIIVELESVNVTEVFTAFGQVGRKAEHVARDVARDVQRYIKADVPVGEYLADQLLQPMAIGKSKGNAGGCFRTMTLSRHSTTHIDIIRKFLDVEIDVETVDKHDVRVRIC